MKKSVPSLRRVMKPKPRFRLGELRISRSGLGRYFTYANFLTTPVHRSLEANGGFPSFVFFAGNTGCFTMTSNRKKRIRSLESICDHQRVYLLVLPGLSLLRRLEIPPVVPPKRAKRRQRTISIPFITSSVLNPWPRID